MKILAQNIFAIGYLLSILTGGAIIGIITNSLFASEYMLIVSMFSMILVTFFIVIRNIWV